MRNFLFQFFELCNVSICLYCSSELKNGYYWLTSSICPAYSFRLIFTSSICLKFETILLVNFRNVANFKIRLAQFEVNTQYSNKLQLLYKLLISALINSFNQLPLNKGLRFINHYSNSRKLKLMIQLFEKGEVTFI